MAIDPNPTTAPAESPIAAIENELPAYRAISSAAVLSLVLGLACVFCFASLWFLVVAAGAIIAGLVALRNIRNLPDILTGAAFARVGIVLASICGLSSITHEVVQEVMTNQDATRFARFYVDDVIVKSKSVDLALWYQQSPEFRRTKSAEQVVSEMMKSKSPMAPEMFKERTAGIQGIKDRLQAKGAEIHFSKIESKLISGLTTYANALFELHGPGGDDQFALIEMVKGPNAGKYDWVVNEVKFPYKPSSAIATAPKADDGHGH